ncbi:MAG: hypothetical protein Q7U74_01815, partial [Saprospiraceae bacterium]|nr:hypothetical protein [Saprospiraceae bacterium]
MLRIRFEFGTEGNILSSVLNILPEDISSKDAHLSLIDGNCALLDEVTNSDCWENAERLCLSALPACEIYSVRPASAGWAVELEYDNLLHEGEGVTP